MSIRRAESADAASIAAVHVAAWQSAYRGLLPDDTLDRLSLADAEARWTERITRPWGRIFVAEQDGRIVGYAACGSREDEDVDPARVGEIYVLYVHPDHWRQGYGRALLGEALRCLRGDGHEEAVLWVLRDNRQAIGFYRAAGFVADGASKVKRRADGTEMPIVRYHRRIG